MTVVTRRLLLPPLPSGIGQIVPLLHQLADHVDAERKVAAARNVTSGKGNARGTVAATGASDSEGTGAGDGKERARLDTERQILLTVLLAHMCSEHDATPRTFVEQVSENAGYLTRPKNFHNTQSSIEKQDT